MSYPQPSRAMDADEEPLVSRRSPRWSAREGVLSEPPDDVVFHLDGPGHFTFLSPAWTSLTGLPVEAVLGRCLLTYLPAEEQTAVRDLLASVSTRARPFFRREVRWPTVDGGRWVELAVFGAPSGQGEMVGTLTARAERHVPERDVLERGVPRARLLETDRLATLGMLVPGFTHEMNNPLAFMTANLDYLLSSMSPKAGGASASQVAEWREAVEEIAEGSERLKRSLGLLRGFRAEPGQGPVDVNALLDTVGQLVSSTLRSRGQLVLVPEAQSLVPGAGGALRQALLNLVFHAVLSLPDDGENPAAHEVRLVTRDDGQGQVVIEIQDTGPGLAPELLPQVFERLAPPGAGPSPGPALWASRDIVRELGGELSVESEPGRGTLFRVTLPGVS
ncbi:MAG: ATP-binding protein [Cystobacter sp.]